MEIEIKCETEGQATELYVASHTEAGKVNLRTLGCCLNCYVDTFVDAEALIDAIRKAQSVT